MISLHIGQREELPSLVPQWMEVQEMRNEVFITLVCMTHLKTRGYLGGAMT